LVLEDHIELRLKIEWEPGIVEFCHIHSFQELDYKPLYDFIEGLYDNPGEFQEISPKLIIDGGNAKQFLKKAAIDGVLYRLFIALGITRYGAILRKKRIVISDESKDTLKALSGCIQKLKNIRWEPSLKNYK